MSKKGEIRDVRQTYDKNFRMVGVKDEKIWFYGSTFVCLPFGVS